MKRPADEFPVCLFSRVNVGIGAVATPDADDLQNDFQRHIQIEEIRFLFHLNVMAGAGGPPQGASLASMVRTRLRMGRIDMTNEFVPTWLLGPRIQQAVEIANGTQTGVAPVTAVRLYDYQRWRLPVPVIVPDGATLLPSFQYLKPNGKNTVNVVGNNMILVHVSMIGRSLNDNALPRVLRVPYVSAFVPGAGQRQSQDDHLVNKFDVPFKLQRFIGRIAVAAAGPEGDDGWRDGDSLNPADDTLGTFGIHDSDGYDVVSPRTVWRNAFNPARKSFTAPRILGPRGWYTVSLGVAPTAAMVPMISMVGWREEELVL